MSDNFTINETLHRYFDGELEPAQAAVVEQQLAASGAMQDELHNLRLARYGVKQWGLKNRLAGLHHEMMAELTQQQPQAAPVRSIKKRWWMMAAAAAAVVLGMLFVTVLQQGKPGAVTPGELFAANYKAYETPSVRGNAGSVENAYSKKQYRQVIELYKGQQQPAHADRFFAACASLETGDAAAAASLFAQVIAANKNGLSAGYQEDAEYYQAMAYLKMGNIAAAKPLFQAIHDNQQHLYNDKVTDKWMEQINQLK